MHNLFWVYFVNFYMFRMYLGHHQEVQQYVYKNWYLLFLLADCLFCWLDWRLTKYTKNNLCIKLVFL
jgi:hypothetical protein